MKSNFIILLLLIANMTLAQKEFNKGWVLNLEVAQGLTTKFDNSSDLYSGELRFSPEYTLIEQRLRVGFVPALNYNNKIIFGTFGPHISINLKTIQIKKLNSSVGNIQWIIEHLWGTQNQKLVGTGLKIELGQTILLSLLTHRDYALNYWRFQFGIGYNFIYKHIPKEIQMN